MLTDQLHDQTVLQMHERELLVLLYFFPCHIFTFKSTLNSFKLAGHCSLAIYYEGFCVFSLWHYKFVHLIMFLIKAIGIIGFKFKLLS